MKKMVRQLLTHGFFSFLCPRFHGSTFFSSISPFFYTSGISRIQSLNLLFIFYVCTYLPSPYNLYTIRAFALNVRTSGVSATSADPRRLEPLIH